MDLDNEGLRVPYPKFFGNNESYLPFSYIASFLVFSLVPFVFFWNISGLSFLWNLVANPEETGLRFGRRMIYDAAK